MPVFNLSNPPALPLPLTHPFALEFKMGITHVQVEFKFGITISSVQLTCIWIGLKT